MKVTPKAAPFVSTDPYAQLVHEIQSEFFKLTGEKLRIHENTRWDRSDALHPPRMFMPDVPVRFDVEPRKLRGSFRNNDEPQVTLGCPRPSGYPKDFEREVSVRYLRRKNGTYDVRGMIRLALDVAQRYKIAQDAEKVALAQRERFKQEEEALAKEVGADEAGISLSMGRFGWHSVKPSSYGRDWFKVTDKGLREFCALMKRERKAVAKLEAKAKAAAGKGEDDD